MNINQTIEYQIIRDYYGEKIAQRSQVPLINHIDEGLQILQWENSALTTQQAYCLHPIFQADETLAEAYTKISLEKINPKALLLVMEYRNIANQYFSRRQIGAVAEINLSPLPAVNKMLLADKIQNRKDFELYHQETHPRSRELAQYFRNWLERLGVSEEKYQTYCQQLKKSILK